MGAARGPIPHVVDRLNGGGASAFLPSFLPSQRRRMHFQLPPSPPPPPPPSAPPHRALLQSNNTQLSRTRCTRDGAVVANVWESIQSRSHHHVAR